MITQEDLKEALDYNPDTGIFMRKMHNNRLKETGCLGAGGYLRIVVNKNLYYSHRLAWIYVYGALDINIIDHANGDKLDNRISNLRNTTLSQNQRNKKMSKNNTSGFTGVTFCKSTNRWEAQVSISNKNIHLGFFDDIDLAIKAREEANIKYDFHVNHGLKR